MAEVKLSEREIISAYSVDEEGHYNNDFRSLKYLKVPDLKTESIDLNYGVYVDGSSTYDIMDRIGHMTQNIMDNNGNFINNGNINADFVCFRGGLKNVMSSPYIQNDWIIKAVKLKNTIYFILDLKEPEKKDEQKINSSFGFKFESYALSSHPDLKPKGKSDLYKKEEFCVLMSRKIDEFKVIFGAEIDGVKSKSVISTVKDLKTSKLIEIKLRQYKGENSKNHLDKKRTIEWWCQSFIASVDRIYVGYHDNGIVKEIEKVETKKLGPAKNTENPWERKECIKRLKLFLIVIKDHMKDIDDPSIGFTLEWNAETKETLTEIAIIKSFLPDKFINFINNL